MDREQEILRGRQAQELLEHPLLVEAFAALESEVLQAWKSSPARDVEGREKLWMLLSLQQKLKGLIESHVTTGKMAKLEVERKSKLLQFVTGTSGWRS